MATLIREQPPDRLSVVVKTPDGHNARWAEDDPNPANVPMGLSFSTVMPGGFERLSCTLERDSRVTYPDTEPMSDITVYGLVNTKAWEGRLEKNPDTAGFQQQEQPEAVGWQAHLEDDSAAREIFVDIELARWQAPSAARKIAILNALDDEEDGTVGAGPESAPAIITQITGAWTRSRLSEMWYDAKGVPLGILKYFWKLQAAGKIGNDDVTADTNLEWQAILATNESESTGDATGSLRAAGPTGSGSVSATATRVWAFVQLGYAGAAGVDGVTYPVFWPTLAAYGTHGLTLYGTLGENEAPGVLASDAVAYTLSRWAPKLNYTIGPEGSIRSADFVIPQLAFLEPTTAAEILKQASRFELLDWAVWEDRVFYMNPRGERGREWRARVGPAQLQQTGPQVSRLWNGVVVTYQDVTGVTRSVGPIGSGCNVESALLEDQDPENPLTEAGVPKWAPLRMGTSTAAGAEQVGKRFLEESKLLDTSGQATLVGPVEDSTGTLWPGWMVRAGDTIRFLDAADPSPRRIVHTSYDHGSRSNAIQLDQPPDGMQPLLERLSVVLVSLGVS